MDREKRPLKGFEIARLERGGKAEGECERKLPEVQQCSKRPGTTRTTKSPSVLATRRSWEFMMAAVLMQVVSG